MPKSLIIGSPCLNILITLTYHESRPDWGAYTYSKTKLHSKKEFKWEIQKTVSYRALIKRPVKVAHEIIFLRCSADTENCFRCPIKIYEFKCNY